MNTLRILYHGQFVGVCNSASDTGKTMFQYAPDFLNSGLELSPLLMPLKNRVFEFDAREYNPQTFNGLPPLIADSLPDDFGHKMLFQWLRHNNISQKAFPPLEKLCYIGKRGMGALEYEPAFEREDFNDDISIADLLAVANEIYFRKTNEAVPLNDYGQSLPTLLRIGSSVGGARAKALIAINERAQEIKAGDILQGEGFEYYLIKFDGLKDGKEVEPGGYGILEYVYHKMAVDAKIDMAECRLLVENGRSHFLTKRFDRKAGQKIHVQTLCGMAGVDFRQPNLMGYEDVFRILNLLNMDYTQKEQLFRRMAFNVLAFNRDDHTKNISFIYEDSSWQLAPAYDMIFAFNPENYWLKNHNLSINGKINSITEDDILAVGGKFGIKKKEYLLADINEVVRNFRHYADKYDYPKVKADAIDRVLRTS